MRFHMGAQHVPHPVAIVVAGLVAKPLHDLIIGRQVSVLNTSRDGQPRVAPVGIDRGGVGVLGDGAGDVLVGHRVEPGVVCLTLILRASSSVTRTIFPSLSDIRLPRACDAPVIAAPCINYDANPSLDLAETPDPGFAIVKAAVNPLLNIAVE